MLKLLHKLQKEDKEEVACIFPAVASQQGRVSDVCYHQSALVRGDVQNVLFNDRKNDKECATVDISKCFHILYYIIL
jgi:hypothetical protein